MIDLKEEVKAAFRRHFDHATPGTPLKMWADGCEKDILTAIDDSLNNKDKKEKKDANPTI